MPDEPHNPPLLEPRDLFPSANDAYRGVDGKQHSHRLEHAHAEHPVRAYNGPELVRED